MRQLVNFLIAVVPLIQWEVLRRGHDAFLATADAHRSGRSDALLAWLGRLLHVALFVCLSVQAGFLALTTPAAGLSALALALSIVYGVIEWRSGIRNLGVFVALGVFGFQLAATVSGFGMPAEAGPARSNLFAVHVITITVACATLLLSGFFGAIYMVMERQMRRRTFGLLYGRLPTLTELATLNRASATVGFVIMTVGLNFGIWQAHDDKTPQFSYRDPKVVATIILWLLFGAIGISRWTKLLSGRKAAVAAVAGLGVLVVTLAVSLVPGLSFHRFD